MIDNSITAFYGRMRGQPRKNKSVGFCHSKKHRGRLSTKMIKQHGCLRKQCPCFEKYEGHPWWEQRDHARRLRKERKEDKNDAPLHH